MTHRVALSVFAAQILGLVPLTTQRGHVAPDRYWLVLTCGRVSLTVPSRIAQTGTGRHRAFAVLSLVALPSARPAICVCALAHSL